jgi:hypothetical protein
MNSPIIEATPAGEALPPEPEAVRQQRQRFHRALQDYLHAEAGTHDWDAVARARARYLEEFLELEFHLRGAARCGLCGVTVRYGKAVTAFHKKGGAVDYSCLCVRCLVAETAISRYVLQRVGPILYEYHAPTRCRLSWRTRHAA